MNVVLQNMLDWNAWTAIGTVSMAVTTVIVILQGRRQRKDDERRHQDGFRPLCILTPYDGVDPWHRRDTLLSIAEQQSPNQEFGMVEVKCELRNIGAGPALNLGIIFRFLDMDGYSTAVWELSALRAGEFRGSKDDSLRIPIQFGARFNRTDFSQVPGKLWEIVIVYEDIFQNHFYSVHQKRPLQLEKLRGVAASPEMSAPSQPWVTFGQGPFPPTTKPTNRSGQSI